MRLGVSAAYVDGRFVPGDVDVSEDVVAAVGLGSPSGTRIAVPGFVDLQVNGIGDVDFLATDRHGFADATRALASTGVTAFQPTLVTSAEDDVRRALDVVRTSPEGARVLGAHLEGPFLATERLGAHDRRWRRDPDPRLLRRFLDTGAVSQVTLAPELPGALELIDLAVEAGVIVACGHTDADAPTAHAAFDRGVRSVTHLFNAMAFGTHRAPAIGMAALARDDVFVTIVLDGHHLSREAAALAWQAAAGRLALVTDRIASSEGAGSIGRRTSRLVDGAPFIEGTLAGSVVDMPACVRALCDLGAGLEAAVAAATEVPARILRRSDVGRLSVGGPADVAILDDHLDVVETLFAGRSVN